MHRYGGDYPPCIEISWHTVGEISDSYPLEDLTVELRPITVSDLNGRLEYIGATWDGLGKPHGIVSYSLNDTGKGYTGAATAWNEYLFPNTSAYEAALPSGATIYRRRLSNWQTALPFTAQEFDTLYWLNATVTLRGQTSSVKRSDTYLIYKVKQFDTLPNIAAYYGVDFEQLARDNHIVDRLVVENNTIFIRNPQLNQDKPYNPPALTNAEKMEIDCLLMGRGLHCEFGFEPINLNTGNFYLETEDASVPDCIGAFSLTRSYNSKGADIQSVFGRGWAFAYDERLTGLADGTIIYHRGDGSSVWFHPDGSGGYTAPSGIYLDLEKNLAGTKTVDFGNTDTGAQTMPVFDYVITDPSGAQRRFDGWGMLTSVVDDKGFEITITYDEDCHFERITTASGYTFVLETDAQGRITGVTLPDGNALGYAYDEDGNLAAFTDVLGGTIGYTYDSNHRMISWIDQNGLAMITNSYDSEGRVTRQLDGNGNASTLVYEPGKTTTTDANGNVTVYEYDAQYRTTAITYPDGTGISRSYNAGNELAYEIDALGNRTSFEYDTNGNITRRIRFDGMSQESRYNENSDLMFFRDFDGKTTTYIYDANGDLVTVTYNDGTATQYTYNANHQTLSVTDAEGNTTSFAWTGALLTSATDAQNNTYTFGYDAMGRATSTTDPLGNNGHEL